MTNTINETLPTPAALARRVASWMTDLACARQDRFAIALSGGSTPRLLYQTLAAEPYLDRFPWQRVHWFWGDERFVAHSDPDSNYRMTAEAMLSLVPVLHAQIHPIPTVGITAEEAADTYQSELRAFYGADFLNPTHNLFDIVLLGLGEDGHTASLFPGSPVLEERNRWTAATDKGGQTRITLTYPALESCANAAFLVSGTSKREILARVRKGDENLPAARFQPMGDLHFFTDSDAAGCAG
ncbi:MAG TPA: 6-phosphogluconolactonase [Rhizomicrobium sp.]|nr:6-phosphogluconolactonase [Rhizomicrobium sp.]